MDEARLRRALECGEKALSEKAVASRLSRARKAEEILGTDLDEVVADDDMMFRALVFLRDDEREHNGNLQNAVRWYYRSVNGRRFPRLGDYAREHRIMYDLGTYEWIGGGDLSMEQVHEAVLDSLLGDDYCCGYMPTEEDGHSIAYVSYSDVDSKGLEKLVDSGILRLEHRWTAAAHEFLTRNPDAGFGADVECRYDESAGWYAVCRGVRRESDDWSMIDAGVLADFATCFIQEAGGHAIGTFVHIMHSEGLGLRLDAFDDRGELLSELPTAHTIPVERPDYSARG